MLYDLTGQREASREVTPSQETDSSLLSQKPIPMAERLIFALDVPSVDAARALVDTLGDAVRFYKIGLELFMAGNYFDLLSELADRGKRVFTDLKFFDVPETVAAAETLIKEGFKVMVYCSDDPIQAQRLEDLGCVAIMPLAAPIGSGLGVQNPVTIRIIKENATVPVLVDAGVGTASDAAIAMELGCDGVLMNTAIAAAKDPIAMARAMRLAIEAGRLAYLAGRMEKKLYADPSSPLGGLI